MNEKTVATNNVNINVLYNQIGFKESRGDGNTYILI